MRSELHRVRRMQRRPVHGKRAYGLAALLAVTWVAACTDESVVDPPTAAIAADAAPTATAMARAGDRDILVALYEATDGPNWVNSENWLTDAPLGAWYGVDTDASGRVVTLDLSGRYDHKAEQWVLHGLKGSIPPELANLTELRTLRLRSNDLTGPIPAELGNLVNLRELDLSHTELSGTIPAELGSLPNLLYLKLYGNKHSGTVPPELGNLSNLQNLNLGWNELTGSIPPEFGSIAGLAVLHLEVNDLTGPIPPQLAELYDLQSLQLSGNQLSGTIPLSFQQLSALERLTFEHNPGLCLPDALVAWYENLAERKGPICPDREVLRTLYEAAGGGTWTNADGWLGDGPLGNWYGVAVDDSSGLVTTLDLEGNGLSGELPGDLGRLPGLTALRIGDNTLSGRLPSSLHRTSLQELRYANTDLCVPIEAWFREWLASLARHEGTGLECPPLSDREILAALYEATRGRDWENADNWLTDAPLGEWRGVNVDSDGRVRSLFLTGLEGPIPPEFGGLAALESLYLIHNRLTSLPPEFGGLAELEIVWLINSGLKSVPPELGQLGNLRELRLSENQLTSVPPELGQLGNLQWLNLGWNQLTSLPPQLGGLTELGILSLRSNELTSVPPELGQLGNLEQLRLSENRLTSLPPQLGGLAKLDHLWLSSNELTSVPPELGDLRNLWELDLSSNQLTSIPREFGKLANLGILNLSANQLASIPKEFGGLGGLYELGLDGNRLTDIPVGLGGMASLEGLDLSSNELSGPLPAGLLELTGLRSLGLGDNAGLAGALPLGLTALERLDGLHTSGTGLCAPTDSEFLDWLEGVTRQRVELCDPSGGAAVYLVQAVQSREFPVPLVAGEPSLLRVFVTAKHPTGVVLPPVRATFYRDGTVTHVLDIPTKPDPIPAEIDESSLSKSINAEIPGWVIQPGLEVVVEPDPEGTLDPALGVATRIPATGRMAVDVRAVPAFEVTLVPFIWESDPDSSIVETTAAMAADPDGHELFEHTRLLLPIAEMDVTAHPAVASPTDDGFDILRLTEMIRVAEGGRGHYLGLMAGLADAGVVGVANGIGSWSSWSILDSETIAHEFGHNRNLLHAPCGHAGGPDRHYPYGSGNIGAWGYDFRTAELVGPGRADYMSYCDPPWTSDYHFTNALRYRMETESNSILVTAADAAADRVPALLVWGGADGEGVPYLKPAFLIDAPPALPEADGPWSLTGTDTEGAVLFSLSFAMAEFTDTDDERAGFSLALPVTWTGELTDITLQGPGGSALLDRDTDLPMTILRDSGTGRIRGILDGPPGVAAAAAPAGVVAAADGQELQTLFSRGIPSTEGGQR